MDKSGEFKKYREKYNEFWYNSYSVKEDDEAYLSEQIAQDLNIKVGDKFKFVISRIKEGRTQNAIVQLTLKGIIKKEYLKYKSILIPLTPLIYMEDFRDGYEPPIFSDGSALNEQRKYFAKARIYVKTLDDVEIVDKKLRAHYQITSALESINNLKAICNVLDFILTVISLVLIYCLHCFWRSMLVISSTLCNSL